MISTRGSSAKRGIRSCCQLILCIFLLAVSRLGFTTEISEIPEVSADASEAWLLTFGPGDIYWERFGHNAIWLREPSSGLDHTFNFGYFDFQQKDFFLRFIRGRMLYFSIAQPSANEFEFYKRDNRSIRAQKLNLTELQFRHLRDYLLNEIKPANRNYRYDYYLNNCSTRIRDALDIALDGALSSATREVPANLDFREQTRRLTQMQFWYYLGLELALGLPADRDISRWDEMFIPMVLADEMAVLLQQTTDIDLSVLPVDIMLYSGSAALPVSEPDEIWFRYLILGLLVVAGAWLSGKFMPPVWLAGLCQAWILITVSIGLMLGFLWFFTDHQVARFNINLLLLNPLLAIMFISRFQRMGSLILIGGTGVAFLSLLFPGHQYNLDVLALVTPVHLAVAAHYLSGNWQMRRAG